MRFPSGLKLAVMTVFSCPWSIASSLPEVSQTRAVPSLELVTIRCPSGLKLALLTLYYDLGVQQAVCQTNPTHEQYRHRMQ
jgi:hypothetical protein